MIALSRFARTPVASRAHLALLGRVLQHTDAAARPAAPAGCTVVLDGAVDGSVSPTARSDRARATWSSQLVAADHDVVTVRRAATVAATVLCNSDGQSALALDAGIARTTDIGCCG